MMSTKGMRFGENDFGINHSLPAYEFDLTAHRLAFDLFVVRFRIILRRGISSSSSSSLP